MGGEVSGGDQVSIVARSYKCPSLPRNAFEETTGDALEWDLSGRSTPLCRLQLTCIGLPPKGYPDRTDFTATTTSVKSS